MAIVITGTSITAPDGAIDAGDLTGDIDASLLTGTLPALDGSALTGLSGGAAVPDWDPSTTPDEEFLVSGTWTRPSGYADTDWVTFYLVGGGGGGSAPTNTGDYWRLGGAGGRAHVFIAKINSLPATLTITVGAGGGNNAAGGATIVADSDGNSIAAGGGGSGSGNNTYVNGGLGQLTNWPASVPDPLEGEPPIKLDYAGTGNYGQTPTGDDSIYGGGSGQGGTSGTAGEPGGTSTYAGNGGAIGQSGFQPGGGGGGGARGVASNGATGGAGSVRIWYG